MGTTFAAEHVIADGAALTSSAVYKCHAPTVMECMDKADYVLVYIVAKIV